MKKKEDKCKDRIPKNAKSLTTVSSILVSEDIKDLMEELIKDQVEIEAMIVIRRNLDGSMTWHVTNNLTTADVIYQLERIKSFTLDAEAQTGEEE